MRVFTNHVNPFYLMVACTHLIGACSSSPVSPLSSKNFNYIVAGGSLHSCSLEKATSRVRCWGDNTAGQAGLQSGASAYTLGASAEPVDLGTGLMVKDLVTGGSFSCVLSTEGKVKCWGLNNYGQLGLGDTNNRGDTSNEMGDSLPFVDLGTDRTAVMISAGNTHACAWLDNNTLKCWGRNLRGELGYGDTNDRGDGPGEMGDALLPVDLGSVGEIREIDLGDTVSCARFSSGQVKCWGRNTFGILALGHTDNIGDGPGEMGSNLSNLNLGSGFTIEDIMLGDDALCALNSEGEVKCTGNLPSSESANLFGDSTGEIGDGIPVVNLGTEVRVKALPNGNSGIGSNTMCALLLDHSVKCWGYNAEGQLGLGNTENRGDGPGEMGDALSALDLQAQTTVQGLVKLGSGHCAMIGDGTLKCWGRNHRGQLGLAHTDNIGDGPGEMGSSTPSVDLGFVLKFE